MKPRKNLVKAYSIITPHTNPDGSSATIKSKTKNYKISSRAIIRGTIYVGNNAIIENAVIYPETWIGDDAIIKEFVGIGSWTTIRTGAMIGCGVVIGSHCDIGPKCAIAFGSKVEDKIRLKKGAIIPREQAIFVDDDGILKMQSVYIRLASQLAKKHRQ